MNDELMMCDPTDPTMAVPQSLHHADALDFTAALAPFFPRTVQFKTLVSHLAWEYLRRWSGGGGYRARKISHLNNALLCLRSISHEAFARNLTVLAYKTFLEKVTTDCDC